jgi:hypothetical protein
MSEPLFMFLVQGIATEITSYRVGARHALLLYSTGHEISSARRSAIAGAEDNGWSLIDVQREKEIDPSPSSIDDDVIRSAVEQSVESGFSMVIYGTELPWDA